MFGRSAGRCFFHLLLTIWDSFQTHFNFIQFDIVIITRLRTFQYNIQQCIVSTFEYHENKMHGIIIY